MSADERWSELARYNAERARGIVHTPEWNERMKAEQNRFDYELGRKVNRPGVPLPPLPLVFLPPDTEARGVSAWRFWR